MAIPKKFVKKEKKVTFELNAPEANAVVLLGDFNSWNESGIKMRKNKNGLWSIELDLAPGKYEYKFIVDGQWWTDPLNSDAVANSYGTLNSVKEVIF